MNAPGTTPEITTEISAWIKSEKHSSPIDSCMLNVYVTLYINEIRVGTGLVSRPFREIPYVTTDTELKETVLWGLMVAEAKGKAMAEAGSLLDALKTQVAA